MYQDGKIYIADSGEEKICILPKMANRHGLIAGATGTGKTVTLKTMAESFSEAGVPVFMADVKGDLAATCREFQVTDEDGTTGTAKYPVTFWDLYGINGLPLRTTISEMGPTLLAHLMDLTKLQEDILSIVFRIADDESLLLIDTKDLRAMLNYVAEHAADYSAEYGNMSKASINVIQRGVVALEEQGGDQFFGEPALNIRDWFKTDENGKGMINILHSATLINEPKLYAVFMLWMLSELFEVLPEVGDLDKPRMIFFFDEAHLLFDSAPKALLAKIDQVVKLIRSKGVGIYFSTQNPKDIPNSVLAQLGNKVQHALHAYTPAEQKGIKAAADSFRVNPAFDTKAVLEELGIGEALISFLQSDGTPMMVQRAKIHMAKSPQGPIDDEERKKIINSSILYLQYDQSIDRDSAYEFLNRKSLADKEAEKQAAAEKEAEKKAAAEQKAKEKEEAKAKAAAEKEEAKAKAAAEKAEAKAKADAEKEAAKAKEKAAKTRNRIVSSVASTTGGTIGRELGNTLGKSVGGNLGKKLGGNIGASLGRGILGNLFKK